MIPKFIVLVKLRFNIGYTARFKTYTYLQAPSVLSLHVYDKGKISISLAQVDNKDSADLYKIINKLKRGV